MPQGETDQPGQISYMYALRMIDQGWSPAQKQQLIAWFGKASKWRGGARFSGHLNNIFNAAIDVLDEKEKQLAYDAAPLFAPLTDEEIERLAARGRGGAPARGGAGAPGRGAAAGGRAAGAAPGGAAGAAPPAAARAGGGGGGRAGGLPASARQVPLDTQERYDNLVFPRGGGPGQLTGRGGGPNPTTGREVFQEQCASCHRAGGIGASYAPDLTNLGQRMQRRDILRAIFFPDEQVNPKYRTTVLTLRDKTSMRGLVVSETAQTLVLKTAEAGDPVTVQKAEIASRSTDNDSIMPANLPDAVGDANLAHVTAFLMNGQ
jgi:putative heme-binding domain-containing protein